MLTVKYLIKNKKRTLITISSVILVTILFLCIGMFFSSIRDYMINKTIKEVGSYHVSLEIDALDKTNIKRVEIKDNINYITYKDITKTYEYTKKLCKGKCQNIKYNDALLSLYGVSKNQNMIEMFKSVLIIILTILSLGIMIIIYNSFAISFMERKKQFSLLKSIGMTKWQMRNMIIAESMIILIIGLFIGFFISVNLMFIILHTINNLLSDFFTSSLKLSFYPYFIIIPITFVVVIVLVSAFLPTLKINKISIINSIRSNDDYKYKKGNRFINKLPLTNKLAYFNYKRCKKKYRPIILCIFISIIIYIAFSMYLNYSVKSINVFNNIPAYDGSVTIINSDNEKKEKLENFALEKSKKYNLFNTCSLKTKLNNKNYNLIIISGNKEYIINHQKYIDTKDGKMRKIDKTYLKSKVTLKINNENKTFKTKDKIPFGIDEYLTKENIVLVTNNLNTYCKNYNTSLLMNAKINLKNEITSFANKENIQNIEYVDVLKATKITNNIITVIKLMLYGITLLVTLISISTIVNTIWASSNLRSKEFGTLKSIGFTQKQMRSMLFYESLYIVIKGFLLALPFIILINYFLHESIIKVFNIENIFPYKELILAFVFLIIIIYLTMIITHKKFNTRKVIQIITNDNI